MNTTLFLPYQKAWIEDPAPIKLMEKARQIGMTWAAACGVVRAQFLEDARHDAWVSSRDELQAKLFLEDCARFANIYNLGAKDLGTILIDSSSAAKAQVLEFSNGRRIHSLSSNPDAQAGKRGTRILDEFALHPDPQKLYSIAYPGATWGGKLEIISTHRGRDNFFNKLVQECKYGGNPKGISLHTVTLEVALQQGFLDRLKSKLPAHDIRQQMDEADYFNHVRNGCPDEESFQQEFCCQPADDSSIFLNPDMIAACEYDAVGDYGLTSLSKTDNPLFIGVDIGREHDLTVIWIIEVDSGVMLTRRIDILKQMSFSEQEAHLYEFLRLPNVKRVCIDQSGIGRQFAERAQQRYGRYRVEGINFTRAAKEELAYPVRAAFEDRAIRIPRDRDLRTDLRAIRRESTSTGQIRFAADRGPAGHSDRFWALALAIHAARGGSSTTHVAGIQRPHRQLFL